MIKGLTTAIRWILTPFVAIILLFEEWGWVPLSALLKRLARLPLWAWLERQITRLPAWAALLVLAVPAVLLFPIKLMALFLIRHGQVTLGITVLISAKLLGTALVARLFQLTEPALMQFGWFAKWYPRWKAWKDRLLEGIRASKLWLLSRSLKARVKTSVVSWLRKLKAW